MFAYFFFFLSFFYGNLFLRLLRKSQKLEPQKFRATRYLFSRQSVNGIQPKRNPDSPSWSLPMLSCPQWHPF